MKKIFVLVTFAFCLFMHTHSHASVLYTITYDGVLNNDGLGAWGGDLRVGANQNLNLSLQYTFDTKTTDTLNGPVHLLTDMRLFDNTNGLSSQSLSAFLPSSSLEGITPNIIDLGGDFLLFFSASFSTTVGGAFSMFAFTNELPLFEGGLPVGQTFDDLLNQSDLSSVIMRAGINEFGDGSAIFNNVSGVNGVDVLQAGQFIFKSELINVNSPASIALSFFFSGLLMIKLRKG